MERGTESLPPTTRAATVPVCICPTLFSPSNAFRFPTPPPVRALPPTLPRSCCCRPSEPSSVETPFRGRQQLPSPYAQQQAWEQQQQGQWQLQQLAMASDDEWWHADRAGHFERVREEARDGGGGFYGVERPADTRPPAAGMHDSTHEQRPTTPTSRDRQRVLSCVRASGEHRPDTTHEQIPYEQRRYPDRGHSGMADLAHVGIQSWHDKHAFTPPHHPPVHARQPPWHFHQRPPALQAPRDLLGRPPPPLPPNQGGGGRHEAVQQWPWAKEQFEAEEARQKQREEERRKAEERRRHKEESDLANRTVRALVEAKDWVAAGEEAARAWGRGIQLVPQTLLVWIAASAWAGRLSVSLAGTFRR
jgi:hypothetical protein